MNISRLFSGSKPLHLALIAVSASALWWFRTPLLDCLSALRDQQAISSFVQKSGMFGPAILFGLLVAQVFLAVIPGHTLMIAGGYVYGFAQGALLTATSTILGSQLAFWLARRCGRDLVSRLASPTIIARWDRLADHQGGTFFFFTFVLPIFPSDLMCYIAGLGKISPWRFFVANVFGRLPCAIVLTLIGAYSLQLPLHIWLVVASGYILVFLVWRVYSRSKLIPDDPDARFYAIVRWLAKCYLALFRLRCKVKGAPTLPAGSKILAANHPNATDAFFLPCILPERPYLLAQGNLFNLPILGWLLSRAGQIPVWPERRPLAFEQACKLLRQGRTIWIFPEGRLNPSGSSMQARTGAVRMSLATGAPIIPIGIHVAEKDTLCLSYRSKSGLHTGRWQVRGCCSFQFGETWYPSRELLPGEGSLPARNLTAMLMDKIYTLAQAASEERGS